MSDDYIDWEKAARKYNIEIGEKDATIARLTKENDSLKGEVERLEYEKRHWKGEVTKLKKGKA